LKSLGKPEQQHEFFAEWKVRRIPEPPQRTGRNLQPAHARGQCQVFRTPTFVDLVSEESTKIPPQRLNAIIEHGS
jgi:hypothetical protein